MLVEVDDSLSCFRGDLVASGMGVTLEARFLWRRAKSLGDSDCSTESCFRPALCDCSVLEQGLNNATGLRIVVPGTLDGGNQGEVQLEFTLYSNRTFLGAQVVVPEERHHLVLSRAFLRRAWRRGNGTISDYFYNTQSHL